MADGTRRTGAIAWAVAFVVPPVVAGGLGHRFVEQHAAWAVVIWVAYEAVVAIGGFFAAIARDISSRWQARLADRVDLLLQRTGPRFERRYRQFMLEWLRFTDTKGLATVGPFTPEHDAVFVNVSLVPRPPHQINPGILPEIIGDAAGRYSLDHFLGPAGPVVLAVVGAPGSGKTTLLRHAARKAARLRRSWRSSRSQVRDIPVLLYLRDHAASIVAEPTVSVAALLRKTPGLAVKDEPSGWFEKQLLDGRCLVLLDGLDEVARPGDRVKVSAWAEAQVRQYPRSSFVISSRPRGYQVAPVEGAKIVQVCGFTTSQVEDFVRGWYRAAERHATGTAGPGAEALAAEGAADLLRRLGQAPALYDLAVNPLLLMMIVNVHRYRGALPGSRADLYSEICQVMLWRRQEAKQLSLQVSGDKKEAILRNLAYVMMTRRVSDLGRADVLAEVQPFLRRVSRGVTLDGFLDDVSSNGLLIERETGQYAFAHKTIQEYLAAAHIRERGLAGVLAEAVSDDWWAETTLLYAAKSNADPIIRACLDDGTAPALALALDCADQDSDVDPGLRERLYDTVASAASSDADHGRRRLFAAILLRRHTRQRIWTGGDSQICPRPVPADIYRLFLADTKTSEPDAPLRTPGIAVGMRSSDADAFVRWANEVSGTEQVYRLPLAAELSELAAQHPIPALPSGQPPTVWTQADSTPPEALPVLWLAPGASDPHKVSKVLLASAIAEDAKCSAPALNGLLLLRARVLIYALNRALDRVRDPDSALDLNLARELTRALDHALDRARDHALDHALDEDAVAVARELTHALDRERELTQGLAREFTEARKRAEVRERELTQARTQVREATRARDRARGQAQARDRELARARVQTSLSARTRDRAQAGELARKLAEARVRTAALTRARDVASGQARERERELIQARKHERKVAQARDGALAQARDRALALDIAQASERDQILAVTLDFDRACTLAQARVLGHALALDDALASSLASDRNLHLDRDLVRNRDLIRDLVRDRALARARGSVFDLTITISEAVERYPLWRSLSEPILSTFDGALGLLPGRIFSMRFMEDLAPASGSIIPGSATWTAVLTKVFTVAAGGEPEGHIAVDPATLEATLHESVKCLARTLGEPNSMRRASSWIAIVAERMQHGTEPVFARTEWPTTVKATASRLAALCLASEADAMERTDIGEMFRQVAAGITLLERRAADQWPASEVIMLAVEQSPLDTPEPVRH
jgi:hypothetical protein